MYTSPSYTAPSILGTAAAALLAITLAAAPALSQGGGGGGGGGGAGGGGAAGGGAGAGAAGSSTSGARSSPSGSDAAIRRAPPNTVPSPNPRINSSPALPGQSAVPGTRGTTSADEARSRRNPTGAGGTPADNADGSGSPSGQTGSSTESRAGAPDATATRADQPGLTDPLQTSRQIPSASGGGSSRREGAAGRNLQECMDTWEPATHMTKAEWRRTCANTLRERPTLRR
jgi:hypothetical protein